MKRQLSIALSASVFAAVVAGCGVSPNATTQVRGEAGMMVAGKAIDDVAVVRVRPGQTLRLRQSFGGKAKEEIRDLGLYSVKLEKGTTINDLKKELGASALYVEKDVTVTMADPVSVLASGKAAPKADQPFNDPESEKQWGIARTQQAEAIAASKGGSKDVVIAIVDSGVDIDHPDLKAKMVKGYNATGVSGLFGLGSPKDDNGHGTHCAGIAAAITDNGVGVAGMAPNAKIMPVRVLAGPGSGSLLGVAKGIVWAANNGADVISLSLGGAGTMPALGDAIQHALKKNSVVIAAMGNSGHNGNPISYPAAYPGVIAVGATDAEDKIAFFSSFNKYCSVSSPGVNIYATTPTYDVWLTKNSNGKITKNYSYMSGTSMATPLVAGLAGLIRSQHPGMAPADVKKLLETTADKPADMAGADWNEKFGFGRINALKAVTH